MFGLDIFWIVVSVVLIILSFLLPFISLYFFALSSLCMSVLVRYFVLSYYHQFIIVSILSLFWFSLLFYLNKSRSKNLDKNVNFDIVGQRVLVVSKTLDHKFIGLVLWSGTEFNAKLSGSKKILYKGDVVEVLRVEGNVLICIPVDNV